MGSRLKLYSYDSNLSTLLSRIDRGLNIDEGEEENCTISCDTGGSVHKTQWKIRLDKLKNIRGIPSKTFIDTVNDTVEILSKLEHANIVNPKRVECIMDEKYLTISLTRDMIRGVPIKVISSVANWTICNVRLFCNSMVQVMTFLERLGIVHGNINDSTILVDDTGVWKIADFGVNSIINCVAKGNRRPNTKMDLLAFAELIESLGKTGLKVSNFVEKCQISDRFSDLLDHPLLQSIHKSFDDFEIIRKLGEGGFGEVLKVVDSKIDKQYAVKRIKSTKRSAMTNGIKEVRALAELSHKNIVRYYRSWTEIMNESEYKTFDDNSSDVEDMDINDSGSKRQNTKRKREKVVHVLYIQMELCHRDLRAKLILNEFKEDRDIYKILIGIANGLKYMHSKNRIHRDLKPENILLTEDETVKIGDFGLSTTRRSLSKKICGTKLYMAPEIGQRGVKARADLYSLGIILFEMCFPMIKKHRKRMIGKIRAEGAPIEQFVQSHKYFQIMKNLLDHKVENRHTAKKLLELFPNYQHDLLSQTIGATMTDK